MDGDGWAAGVVRVVREGTERLVGGMGRMRRFPTNESFVGFP